jgi:hypothetical protein
MIYIYIYIYFFFELLLFYHGSYILNCGLITMEPFLNYLFIMIRSLKF